MMGAEWRPARAVLIPDIPDIPDIDAIDDIDAIHDVRPEHRVARPARGC
jgi:hypothetical protein